MRTLPRLQMAHLPTPVEDLPRLSDALGGIQIKIKRDDQTGLAFGGNKTRKLELLVADAIEQGAKTLVTAGAVQSNHCRQTAAAAARCGLECVLVLGGDPPDVATGNLLLDKILGAEIVYAGHGSRDQVLTDTFETAKRENRKPYLIPYGGSSPIGAAAYALAFEEVLAQTDPPDWVVFASSSGGTHAGLVLGARLAGFSGKVLGISIDEPAQVLRERVAALAAQTAHLLNEPIAFSSEDILVKDGYLGQGYGVMGELERGAVRLFARTEGILLDPVYTGRAAGGMIDLIRKGALEQDQVVLFWHTGGAPALFADKYMGIVTG